MPKSNTIEKWIEAGYELFALEGPQGIQVERMARMLSLNKSGFYHYFGDHDTFIYHLVDHHRDCVDQYLIEVQLLKNIDPEYLELMIKYKLLIMVHAQLGRNRNNNLFSVVYADLNVALASVISPLWAEFVNMSDNPELALRYFELVRSAFNSQVRFTDLNYEVLRGIALDAKTIVEEIIKRETSFISAPLEMK